MSATLVWSEWRLTSVLIWDCLNLIFVCFRRHTVVWKMHYLIRMCCTWRAFRKSALHQSRSTSRWLKNIFIWYFCFLLSFLALKGTKLCCFILFPPAVGYSIPSCSGVQQQMQKLRSPLPRTQRHGPLDEELHEHYMSLESIRWPECLSHLKCDDEKSTTSINYPRARKLHRACSECSLSGVWTHRTN